MDLNKPPALAQVMHTPFGWILDVLNYDYPHSRNSVSDNFRDALMTECKSVHYDNLDQLQRLGKSCIFLEAALVTLFLSRQPRQQYEQIPAEFLEDMEYIFRPDKETNEILLGIFIHPSRAIFGTKITFTRIDIRGVTDRRHTGTRFDVGFLNHENETKVVGLWDASRPVLFKEKEFNFRSKDIEIRKLEDGDHETFQVGLSITELSARDADP